MNDDSRTRRWPDRSDWPAPPAWPDPPGLYPERWEAVSPDSGWYAPPSSWYGGYPDGTTPAWPVPHPPAAAVAEPTAAAVAEPTAAAVAEPTAAAVAEPTAATAAVQPGRPTVEVGLMRRQVARTAARVSPATQQWLVLGALALGGAFTLYLWWHGSPEGWMDSYMNVANGLAQISGMLGEYLFLVQVLLMARVPLLERALGTELLAKLHTVIGFLVLEFVSVHIVGATYLNARRPDVSHLVALAGVFLGIRDVLLATFGTTFLYLAGYLSTRTLRRRIPYEVWRYLHMLVYIGLALELVHQYTLGPHFLNSMWTSIAWGGMHAVVIVLVAWYRVGFVVRQNLRHRLRVDRVVDEGPGVYSIYLVGHRLEKLHGSAGQFCRFRFLNREGWWQSHPFSLSAAPAARYMRITVKELGDWTGSEVSRLRPGTVAFFSGPYGGLTPERRRGRKVVLIAAGIGITPMRSLLAGLPARPGELTLVYRARSEDDLVFREELDELARQRGATVHYLLGPRGQFLGGEPLGADQLQALIPDLRRHDAYLCGPESMIAAAITGLREGGVPRNRIHSERFVF